MTTPPTIVAVDVDGVVNAVPRTDADLADHQRWQRRTVAGFTLTVAGEVVDWLTTLDRRGGEFHWASTWTPNRRLLEEAFGLPGGAPVAADPDAPVPPAPPGVSWKGAQVADLVSVQRRPLVWMDDDAITDATVALLEDLAERLACPMLLVAPRMSHGLLTAHMDRVDDFLAGVRGGAAGTGVAVVRA